MNRRLVLVVPIATRVVGAFEQPDFEPVFYQRSSCLKTSSGGANDGNSSNLIRKLIIIVLTKIFEGRVRWVQRYLGCQRSDEGGDEGVQHDIDNERGGRKRTTLGARIPQVV